MLNKIKISVNHSNGPSRIINYNNDNDNEIKMVEIFDFNKEESKKNEGKTREERLYNNVKNNKEPVYFTKMEAFRAKEAIMNEGKFDLVGDEKFIYYYMNIEKMYGDTIDIEKKIAYAKVIMNEDQKEENNQFLLYSTPMKVEATTRTVIYNPETDEEYIYEGTCLSFYSESNTKFYFPLREFTYEDGKVTTRPLDAEKKEQIIKNVCKYNADARKCREDSPKYYQETIDTYLKKVSYVYIDPEVKEEIYNKMGVNSAKTNSRYSHISLNVANLDDSYERMLGAYMHETGHTFARATSRDADFDHSEEYKEIYDTINELDPDNDLFREYAHKKSEELFADSVAMFLSNNMYANDDLYNKENLKAITIEVDGEEMTYYDYMDNLLNGKYEYKYRPYNYNNF